MNIEKLKESLGALENTLLAIDELSHVCQQAINSGNHEIDLQHCANLLHYLMEPALLQVEAARDALEPEEACS